MSTCKHTTERQTTQVRLGKMGTTPLTLWVGQKLASLLLALLLLATPLLVKPDYDNTCDSLVPSKPCRPTITPAQMEPTPLLLNSAVKQTEQ